MDFENILAKLLPKLIGIAYRIKLNGHLRLIDEDDLIQEMSLHLWEMWVQGETEGKTDSYLLQSCWFHIKNYLRVVSDKIEIVSLNEPIDNEETTPAETIPDNSQYFSESVDWEIIIDEIETNRLTEKEKKVFILRLKGYTLREIGKILGISFVRVSKIKSSICKKLGHKIY
ncbi:MAG: sigma-70 family RNA polymerase sigma factor [Endomicrobiia bacterium]